MLTYVLRRLLWLPPTFFFISLLLFVLLNLAPGRPGDSAGGGDARAIAGQRESYQLFKRQFGLDKPVLWNLRFLTRPDEVRAWLEAAHGLVQAAPATRGAAEEALEDGGDTLVIPLVALIDDDDVRIVRAALGELRRLLPEARIPVTGEGASANVETKDHGDGGADDLVRPRAVARSYVGGAHERFTFSAAERVAMFFFDTRFARFWRNLLVLDFGVSTVNRVPVMPTIAGKLRYTLALTLVAILLAYGLAVPLGVWSAAKAGTRIDATVTVVVFVLYSLPSFFVATVLLAFFAEGHPLAVFPAAGFESLDGAARTTLERLRDIGWHLALPVATYTAVSLAALSRYARAGVLEVIRAEWVRTARAKGLPEWMVLVKHVGRNGMLPILTLLGGLLPALVSGSVVIEVVFGIPGMGSYLVESIGLRDYNAVMGVLAFPSVRSFTSAVPSGVPSVFHSSFP